MEKLKCIIIEDQIPAQEILKSYVERVPYLDLLQVYVSPLEALVELERGDVDVLFLDVHMPKLSGIELLKMLNNPPQTILTTAFSAYAVEGFELEVVDYLLKPYSFGRFLKSVAKLRRSENGTEEPTNQPYLFVRNKGQIRKIALSDIEYIEARGDFAVICTSSNREVANTSLQNILASLGGDFIRCHKSYVINIASVEKIVGNTLILKNTSIPIGRSYKASLLDRIRLI